MSIYESSITNPKKQLEFYKDLSEQLLQERNNYKELYEKEKEKNEILGQTIVGQQHTIRVLKKHKREQKHNHKQQNKKLKYNWNKLKEWLKEQDVFITELPAFTKEISIEHKTMSICYENILDKMQEIERL